MSTNFCVDSSRRFPFKARTDKNRQTDRQSHSRHYCRHQLRLTGAAGAPLDLSVVCSTPLVYQRIGCNGRQQYIANFAHGALPTARALADLYRSAKTVWSRCSSLVCYAVVA